MGQKFLQSTGHYMPKFIALFMTLSLFVLTFPNMQEQVDASDTIVVNCSQTYGDVTHVASGSLYGITETIPTDIDALVTPLNPNVFTSPARAGSDYQQPYGAAIDVAERITDTTGKVMIRLADICPDWPYSFPGMSSWKSQVEDVIEDKLASTADNFYGYEIWNEPVYTWDTDNGTFYNLWETTYDLIRDEDSSANIIGPSEGYYDHDLMLNFLTYCVNNDCVPDILSWHELSSNSDGSYVGDFASHITDLESIESSLGLGDIPISINEYCDLDHSKEGCPGSMAEYIAKFERYGIDSACISWWWTAYPGRLGSLLASDTQKGAGWWFYKWYGDMSGEMLKVTPPDETSDYVDAFACSDSDEEYISCLLGGNNSGTINVQFDHLPNFIGTHATVVVQEVTWSGKDVVSEGPLTVLSGDYTLTNHAISVQLTDCSSTSGYRVYVTPGIDTSTTRYEAEDAMITEANIFENSSASNGAYVGQIDYNDSTTPRYSYVDFVVNMAESKTYTMTIHYANGSGAVSTQGLAYNSGDWETVSYPETSAWADFSDVTVSVDLNAGINIIRLAKGSPYFDGGSDYAELDYIELE